MEHYPRRYEDRTQFAAFPTASSEESICLRGIIHKMSAQYFGGRKIVEVTLEDLLNTALSGRVICRWFNQHYLQRMLATGQELIVYGRPKQYRNRIYLDHPEFELIEEEGEENIHMGRITPIYPLTEGVRQRAVRSIDVSSDSGTSGAATEPRGYSGSDVGAGSAQPNPFSGELA